MRENQLDSPTDVIEAECVKTGSESSRPGLIPLFLVLLSVGIFVASLLGNGFYIARNGNSPFASGAILLLMGWLGLLDGIVAWFANPLLLISWCYCAFGKAGQVALGFAGIAFLLAASFLLCQSVTDNPSGIRSDVTEYGWGYGLWMTSIVVAILAAFATPTSYQRTYRDDREWWQKRREKRKSAKPESV